MNIQKITLILGDIEVFGTVNPNSHVTSRMTSQLGLMILQTVVLCFVCNNNLLV